MLARNEPVRRLTLFIVTAVCALVGSRGWGATPESPEVKELVARGYRFLESVNKTHDEWGGDCLVGLTFVKKGERESHPAVKRAIERVRQVLSDGNFRSHSAYSTALAGVFLCELDAQKFRPEIDKVLAEVYRIQRKDGAWGYSNYATGDTSQTQYGVLCLLTARRAGIHVPQERVERAAAWLCRTQDVGGGWGYQGQDTSGGKRVNQSGITLSLSAAGAGSLVICGQMLGVTFAATAQPIDQSALPPGLTLVTEDANPLADGNKVSSKDAESIRRAAADADRWFDRNYRIEVENWQHYYLYALERYITFRDLAAGRDEKEPRWYNDGVALLAKTQAADGSWTSGSGPAVDTCFAILFLTRATKTLIPAPRSGALGGGRGFPIDVRNVILKDGKIVAPYSPDDLKKLIAEGNIDELVELPDGVPLETDPQKLAGQLLRLRRLVAAKDYKVRLLVVKTLGKTDDYDCIPHLIYALTDPNWKVTRAAHDALRHITRRFEVSYLPDELNEPARAAAIDRWKKWYLVVNPNAVFLGETAPVGR